LEDDFAVKY